MQAPRLPITLFVFFTTCSWLTAEPSKQSTAISPEVLAEMRQVHAKFDGQRGYVAQSGDSITYSMAFWSPMSWDDPSKYLTEDDGLPKTPREKRWRDTIKGARG